MSEELKIGMYTTDEILEHLTEGEGRGFLGRSMYDAIIDYITNLQEEYKKEQYLVDKLTRQLSDEYKNTEYQCKQKEKLNNIINELEKWLEERSGDVSFAYHHTLNKLQELKGSNK